jgi:ribosomal protein L44E
LQAKTTKKIVLRLQCATCKFTHQHAIKARAPSSFAFQP